MKNNRITFLPYLLGAAAAVLLIGFTTPRLSFAGQAVRPLTSGERQRQALGALSEASTQLAEIDKIYARTMEINSNLSKLYKALSDKAADVSKRAETVGAGKGRPSATGANGRAQDELMQSIKQMQETQMSFNLQYLQLQSQMQNDNRQYTAVTNIMKTKHDTVKNSISNIR